MHSVEANNSHTEQSDKKTRRNVRNCLGAMLLAGLILAVFNPLALQRYVGSLPPSVFTEELLIVTEKWTSLMEQYGPAEIQTTIRDAVTRFQQQRF